LGETAEAHPAPVETVQAAQIPIEQRQVEPIEPAEPIREAEPKPEAQPEPGMIAALTPSRTVTATAPLAETPPPDDRLLAAPTPRPKPPIPTPEPLPEPASEAPPGPPPEPQLART